MVLYKTILLVLLFHYCISIYSSRPCCLFVELSISTHPLTHCCFIVTVFIVVSTIADVLSLSVSMLMAR